MRSARSLSLMILWTLTAFGQTFRAGLQAGIPFTEYFHTGPYSLGLHGGGEYSAATRRYTLGVFAEWRLTDAVAMQSGALYHRMGYVAILNFFDSANGSFRNTAIDVKGNSWDFPLLAKYRFRGRVRPYAAGGGVLRYVGPVRGKGEETVGSLVTNTSSTTPLDTSQPSDLRKRFYPGICAAGGVELGKARIRIRPELRYTRWTANLSGAAGALRFAPNQLELLVALTF
jgi:hypothetical protein